MAELTQADINKLVAKNKSKWYEDAMRKANPVARRWAYERLRTGEDWATIEEDFMEIDLLESKLYSTIKQTMIHHVNIHGLDKKADIFFETFIAIKGYRKNNYNQLLCQVRKAFVKGDDNHSLEYLISKINEFVHKVTTLSETAYKMLIDGKKPDLDVWSDKAALQDAVFEENKQFLKQTLNHLNALYNNKANLGIAEIRLLLAQKDGCRREKLYRQVEFWITRIFDTLPEETEADKEALTTIYRDICTFVKEVVPSVGYITPYMIEFIFSRGYLSKISRDLLIEIKPIINMLGMSSLFDRPLANMLADVKEHFEHCSFSKSDKYVVEIAQLYNPKLVSQTILSTYELWAKNIED